MHVILMKRMNITCVAIVSTTATTMNGTLTTKIAMTRTVTNAGTNNMRSITAVATTSTGNTTMNGTRTTETGTKTSRTHA